MMSTASRTKGRRRGAGIAFIAAFVLVGPRLAAQSGIEAYDRGDWQAVRAYLSAQKTETAELLFLRAAMTTDADSALEIYRQVVLKYPESPISLRALDRVRQYFYAQGKYEKAAEFEKALKGYSPPAPRLTQIPPSPGSPESAPAAALDSTAKSSPRAPAYCLQVGAFSDLSNANRLKTSLEKAGYQVVIQEAGKSGNQLHIVRVFGFARQEEALRAAAELQQKFQLHPILVPLEKQP